MSRYGDATRETKQTEPLLGEQQVPNSAGGYVYQLSPLATLERFLILGTEGGTYYAKEAKLTKENAANLERMLSDHGVAAVKLIVDISQSGRAAKNDPAVFALAVAARHSNADVRKAAYAALPLVCRIPTHLMQFVDDLPESGRWSRGLRNAVSRWYTDRPVDKLAYQMVKYQQRNGNSHARLLRQAHPHTNDPAKNALFRWALNGAESVTTSREIKPKDGTVRTYAALAADALPPIVQAFESLKGETSVSKIVQAIVDFGLTREMLPTEALRSAQVWEALLQKMPITALIRNLGVMTANHTLGSVGSTNTQLVIKKLGDQAYLHAERVHPLKILTALKIYAQGHGMKGDLSWEPVQRIVDALDSAFYLAFKEVEPTGKRLLLALDVSGSMTMGQIAGAPLTPIEAEAALALVTANVESDYTIMGFSHKFVEVPISPKMRLDQVVQTMSRIEFGSTDCSLPWVESIKRGWDIDACVTITDNETYAGREHPKAVLERYRRQVGHTVKSIVVGMTATSFSIADPKDPHSLDMVGFDTNGPAAISAFVQLP